MLKAGYYLDGTDKLRELILYVCAKCETDKTFGLTKLNKLLFFSDFLQFARRAESITGQEYFKLPAGPAPRIMIQLLDAMVEAKELSIVERMVVTKMQKKPLALRPPNLKLLSSEEIAMVDDQILNYWGMTATEISRASHDFIHGWETLKDKETLPFAIVLVDRRELTDEEKQWASEIDPADLRAAMTS